MDTAWGDGHHYDLRIVADDIGIGDDGEPLLIDGRPSIAQDVGHAIRESQMLVELIGERNALFRRALHQRIEQLVEDDVRIIPGTCRVTEQTNAPGKLWVQAKTYEYKDIAFYL